MSDGLLNGLLIIPILAVLILVHEIGHFVAARSVGVKVEEFGIGIPPRLKGWTRNGVIWSINWIPFGGFVRVKGEDANDTDPGSMNTKRPSQRAFFLVAGSAMNFLLAIVLMVLVLGLQGEARTNFYLTEIKPNSPAAAAGWQIGDRIVEVAGAPVERDADVRSRSAEFAGRPMSVVLERGGQLVETEVTPRVNAPADQGAIGIGFAPVVESDTVVEAVAPGSPAAAAGLEPDDRVVAVADRDVTDQYVLAFTLDRASGATVPITVVRGGEERRVDLAMPQVVEGQPPLETAGATVRVTPRFEPVPAGQIVPRGFEEAWLRTVATVGGVRDLVTGNAPLGGVAGPVGMGQAVSEYVQISTLPLWVTLADITILLSLNLGVLNLLPLPALDGGRLLFVLVEVLRGGRRIAPEREGLVHLTGFVLLLGLMLVITFFDFNRIIDGRSFLP